MTMCVPNVLKTNCCRSAKDRSRARKGRTTVAGRVATGAESSRAANCTEQQSSASSSARTRAHSSATGLCHSIAYVGLISTGRKLSLIMLLSAHYYVHKVENSHANICGMDVTKKRIQLSYYLSLVALRN